MSDTIERAGRTLERIKSQSPLVHCLTNSVVKNVTANALLALGAAPAMVEDPVEASEFASIASALLINVGTLDTFQASSMQEAVVAANKAGTPWALDPVAVGPLSVRTQFAQGLLSQKPTLIRGNASEIIALSGRKSQGRGTDSGDSSEAAIEAAVSLISKTGGAVLATGPVDCAVDKNQRIACSNGHPLLTRVTGIGCAQGAIAAACLACADSPFDAAIAAALIVAIAGEIAAERAERPGSFQIAFLDALDELTPEVIAKRAKLS
ncbi:hydroxyethylthiazole kinase [Pelagicoccus sp. SDUM812003]|uniref:hydroxyethylthiazole kinase n=1 Tax=Pelagicoccus sp. SDUM812003 TaxID=3041267 RepID=UPI00280FF512|nr:hydroxyethylthiazole kinase [Pelagicoccus sp. SDUM812003]MDQ8201746.1 hydroxyethylthiazole kinase [Pelagicoccus sp. SDUM812003]